MDPSNLRQRARFYRRAADQAGSPEKAGIFLDLAERFESVADMLEQRLRQAARERAANAAASEGEPGDQE